MLSRFILFYFCFELFFIILFAVLVVDFVSCSIFLYEYSHSLTGFPHVPARKRKLNL